MSLARDRQLLLLDDSTLDERWTAFAQRAHAAVASRRTPNVAVLGRQISCAMIPLDCSS